MKKTTILIVLCACLFFVGIAGSLFVWNRPHGAWVEILQDDEVIHRINLSEAEDQLIEIEYNGRINTVQIENHRIKMSGADCPDHTCINMGWLDSAVPIVCLPNHLVIRFASLQDEADVIVQ